MRIVIALGGNALLRRGEPMTAPTQRRNIAAACEALAPLAVEHELVITHGNGPQVGLLALQAARDGAEVYPFDVLGAETEGMIGYVIEQELGNRLPVGTPLATLVTMTEVDADDPAFVDPTKFVGPTYNRAEAAHVGRRYGWTLKADGDTWRRVVPSPRPQRIVEIRPVEWLLKQGTVVICAGGGGVPAVRDTSGVLTGVEAVIDKDRTSAVLAEQVDADALVIVTDVHGVYVDWGTPQQRMVVSANPDDVDALDLPAGSMGPKVQAAAEFARRTGRPATIGALSELPQLLRGHAGTRVSVGSQLMTFR